MTIPFFMPPGVAFANGHFTAENIITKVTHSGDLAGIFHDQTAWRAISSETPIYQVEMLSSAQGEIYFGLRGSGLLLLQTEQGEARLEQVFPGSVHIIPGFTAHRLINTGTEILSALAVWPTLPCVMVKSRNADFGILIV